MKLKWKNRHYFNAPDENKSSHFCKCGKFISDKIHFRASESNN